jgi:DNA polymerase V
MHSQFKLEGKIPFQRGLVLAESDAALPQATGPLLASAVPAGFPSPADDYVSGRISLDAYLVQHQEATFFLHVSGDSMRDVGIFDGDLLVVDRALQATHESVVIAVVDAQFMVKQLLHTPQGYVLHSANPAYSDIVVGAEQELTIWGVVRWAIHRVSG